MHVVGRVAALWLVVLAPVAVADLELELYEEAKKSKWLLPLGSDDQALLDFLGPKRPQPNLIVMFHDEKCNICRHALVQFERVAADLKGGPIAFAHVDCTRDKSSKERLHLAGFPSVRFWRAPGTTTSAPSAASGSAQVGLEEEQESLKALVGQRVRVDGDGAFVLRATRQAGMSETRDNKRLQAAGQFATILSTDGFDLTAEVLLENTSAKVWLPLEVLYRDSGEALPWRRAHAAVAYKAAWQREELRSFAERLMRPFVGPLRAASELPALMRGDPAPSLVFCGPEVTKGFLQAVVPIQAVSSAFHADHHAACPVRAWPAVVVYSSTLQQWAPETDVRAAVAVASPEIVANDSSLVDWILRNRYPGIMQLGYHNFQEFLNAGRNGMLVAIDTSRAGSGANRVVQRRLLEIGNPELLDNKVYRFSYDEDSLYLGVADGTLEGMSSFGVYESRLPRVVIFEGPSTWVEDENKLTIERLSLDLKKVPHMWRMGHGWRRRAVWLARECARAFVMYDEMATASGGQLGRIAFHVLLVVVVAMQLKMVVNIATGLVSAMFGESEAGDAPPTTDAGMKRD